MDIEHSRLLKFLLPPASNTTKMSEQESYKVKFEYANPENIDAEVPNEQNLRENGGITSKNQDGGIDGSTFVPVMTVTKEEAVFTKGDMKLQKISVTENISEKKNGGMYIVINPLYSTITGEVINGPQPLRDINTNGNDDYTKEDKSNMEEKRTKTRIPMLKFKQTVEKVKKKRKDSVEAEDEVSPPQMPQNRRSSIPRLRNRRLTSAVKDTTVNKNEEDNVNKDDDNINKDSTVNRREEIINYDTIDDIKPEEEFDKIYEEIVDNEQIEAVIDETVLNIEDPEQLETSFEELIHAYDELEKPVAKSKIPLLKQKSLHDIKLPVRIDRRLSLKDGAKEANNTVENVVKIKSDLRPNESKVKEKEKDTIKDDQISEVNNDIIGITIEISDVTPITITVEEQNTRKEFVKETIKVATPVFTGVENRRNLEIDSSHDKPIMLLNENSNSSEIPDSTKMVRNIQAATQVKNIKSEDFAHDSDIKEKTIDHPENNNDVKKEIVVLRGKVGQIINKLDPKESVNETKSNISAIPKKTLVVTKLEPTYNTDDSKIEQTFIKIQKDESGIQTELNHEDEKPLIKTKHLVIKKQQTIENNKQETDNINKTEELPINYVKQNTKTVENDKKITVNEEDLNNNCKKAHNDTSDEEIPILKGKVGRIISRLASSDTSETNHSKREFTESIPKKKSISSRIALFERQLSDTTPTPKPNIETKIPKPTPRKTLQKPKIVDELLKPQTHIDSVVIIDKVDVTASETYEDNLKVMDDLEQELNNLKEDVSVTKEHIEAIGETNESINENNDELVKEVTMESNQEIRQPKKEESKTFENNIELKSNDDRRTFNNNEFNTAEYKVNNEVERRDNTNELIKNEFNVQEDNLKVNDDSNKVELNSNNDTRTFNNNEFNTVEHKVKNEVERKDDNNQSIRNEFEFNVLEDDFKLTDDSIIKTDDAFTKIATSIEDRLKRMTSRNEDTMRRSKSVAELDLGDAVKGKVHRMIVRINSIEKIEMEKKEINLKERPRKRSVSEKIALFERKLIPVKMEETTEKTVKLEKISKTTESTISDEVYNEKIAELTNAKLKYGKMKEMIYLRLRNGRDMPVLALGTALLDPRLLPYVIGAAIDLGYRAIDTAFIYGNEKAVGEAIKAKIDDGTVRREDLFITSKLWSTFHRQDLVEMACKSSLEAMGLQYFDLYLIHNPMSLQEGADAIPKIANVIQYSTSDYLDAWYGMEELVNLGLVKSIGVSNFNSEQIARVTERGRVKPVVNQVECHPYLTQQRLEEFCTERDVKLNCFGVLGSKGTPDEFKSSLAPVIEDPLVKCMAAGLNVTPAQLLLRYQIECGHSAIVKCSSAAHLWENLQALTITLSQVQIDALHALNRNKRTYGFKGMGDTHKNYPFRIPF